MFGVRFNAKKKKNISWIMVCCILFMWNANSEFDKCRRQYGIFVHVRSPEYVNM